MLLIGFLSGLILASFLSHSLERMLLHSETPSTPRHCTKCDTTRPVTYYIPILDLLINLGKCPQCGEKRHLAYLWLELVTITVITYLFLALTPLAALQLSLAGTLLIGITVMDVRQQLVPNLYTSLLLGLPVLSILFGDRTLIQSFHGLVAGAIISGLLLLPQWVSRETSKSYGLGDVKLILVVTLWLGWILTVYMMLLATISGLIAFIIIWMARGFDLKFRLAFGPFVAFFTLLFALWRIVDPQIITNLLSFRF